METSDLDDEIVRKIIREATKLVNGKVDSGMTNSQIKDALVKYIKQEVPENVD